MMRRNWSLSRCLQRAVEARTVFGVDDVEDESGVSADIPRIEARYDSRLPSLTYGKPNEPSGRRTNW